MKLTFTTTILLLCFSINAQVEYLRLSPAQKIIQRVGATDVTIEFSRPQMKGRKIFDGLVPLGKMWRTGANENTIIAFNHRVKIGETEVAEGKYALMTKPMQEQWEVYLYTDTNNLDVPNPIDSSKLIYLTTVPSRKLAITEKTLVINLYNITETTADLGISWENTAVRIPITFYTREAMEKQIEKEFKQNTFDYSIAASYYSQRGIELQEAKQLQELAMELKEQPSAWDYHSYGMILMQLEEQEKAIENLQRSLRMAKESGNDYLIKENGKVLAEMK
ncbi:MAG: DUF2911 domain-containing protein [Bacteroidota bacterium]